MPNSAKHILIAPLNWGLGHATRCIPIINSLLEGGSKISIAAEGLSKKLLQDEFPQLNCINLKGYEVYYPSNRSMAWTMFKQIPKIIYGIYKEHKLLQKIISAHKVDTVISDNRYGLWNKQIKSIFITHQIEIQTPKGLTWLKPFINKVNLFFISKYNECWIPDFEGEPNLSGSLSHNSKLLSNAKFIGTLSRFKKDIKTNTNYELVIILSGPEPQRTIFENFIFEQIKRTKLKALIVRGKINSSKCVISNPNVEITTFLDAKKLNKILLGAKYIICRSGYSSIMDLIAIDKTAVLIPTPGQTEQEYLAKYLSKQNLFLAQRQKHFDLEKAIHDLDSFNPKSSLEILLLSETTAKHVAKLTFLSSA